MVHEKGTELGWLVQSADNTEALLAKLDFRPPVEKCNQRGTPEGSGPK